MGAIQDDALIHLRYAHFLHNLHFITFDGVHTSYGTSSLFYVVLLAVLRSFTLSPLLLRTVSSAAHLCLFASFAVVSLRAAHLNASARVQSLALAILLLLALPSAVRWLDDGMETGIVVGFVSLAAWMTHRLSLRMPTRTTDLLLPPAFGFLLVIVRCELGIVALFCSAALCLAAAEALSGSWISRIRVVAPKRSGFLLGALAAGLLILLLMHQVLPDTALAKSQGAHHFQSSLVAAAKVTAGALLFGMGSLILWLTSAVVVLVQRQTRRLPTLLANFLFPCVLIASALRGQEIQGVRYFVWTFFFSLVWNLLELWQIDELAKESSAMGVSTSSSALVFTAFMLLCLLALPLESRLMLRVLTIRARTMKRFMADDLADALQGKLGVASDIGYIAFYTRDYVCDLEGLTNGRSSAAMTEGQRLTACVAKHPDFAFVNASQAFTLSRQLDIADWMVCGEYDLANTTIPDRHFLVVRPEDAAIVCKATGSEPIPALQALLQTSYN